MIGGEIYATKRESGQYTIMRQRCYFSPLAFDAEQILNLTATILPYSKSTNFDSVGIYEGLELDLFFS